MNYALPDGTVYGRYLGREWREARGLSLSAMQRLGAGRYDRISSHEHGGHVPTPRVISERAEAVGCHPSDLWQWADHSGAAPADGAPESRTPWGWLRLRGLREAAGLSLADVAERIGTSKQLVWQWETGRRTPNLDTIWRLSQALGVPTGHLWRWA